MIKILIIEMYMYCYNLNSKSLICLLNYFDKFSALFGKNVETCRQRLQLWRTHPSSIRKFEFIWNPNAESSYGNIRSKREADASTQIPIVTTNPSQGVSGSAEANRLGASVEDKNSKSNLFSSATLRRLVTNINTETVFLKYLLRR